MSKIPINDALLDKILKSSKNKVFFNNGYYDFKQKKFIDIFNDVETLIKIDRAFVECSIDQQNKNTNPD